jgi:acetylornithine deacetylase/succinyl-diaminopimelate desuccinylase-like protein
LPTSSRATAARGARKALAYEAERSLPRLVEMTQALVRVASPNPPGDTSAVAEVAEGLLAAIPGIEIQRVEPEPGIVSLVARVRARKPGRRLIFNGHLDTFPVGESAGWSAAALRSVA